MNKKVTEKLVLKKSIRKLLSKALLTTILFLIGMIFLKENPNQKGVIEINLYEKSLPFQMVKTTYEKYFGNVLSAEKLVKNTEPVFQEKLSYEKLEKYQDGIKLKVSNHYMVPIIESGVIVFIGEKENLGNTIIVEQIDGVDTFYSNVTLNNRKLYDYVEKGEVLGETNDTTLYLSFQKKGEIIDYQTYI